MVSFLWSMQPEPTITADEDEQAVAAVRRGDAERYRELVERHERRVFAVAWSRLGDAALAEDATQEAFIRGYRHLALLSDGAKFSAWINSIARHAAIGLGLRHRRELNKRERWAMEQPSSTEPPDAESERCTPETLRETLAELPSAYRECLVLFYLEGKSGTEAAAALGISESALRVRLHRARADLRERLEECLGESLEQLRSTKPIAPSVMAAILSSSTGKAAGGTGAGAGATILSVLTKVLPVKFVASLFGFMTVVPTLAFAWWMGRIEERNYIDGDGFRARLHRSHQRRMMWGIGVGVVIAVAIATCMALKQIRHHSSGLKIFYLVIGLVYFLWTLASARALAFARNRFLITNFVFVLLVAAGAIMTGLGVLSPNGFALFWALSMVTLAFGYADRPLRMDYNLFLRATQGMLESADAETSDKEASLPVDLSHLRKFARFLCARRLAMIYSRCPASVPPPIQGMNRKGAVVEQLPEEGLVLPLHPVNPNWRGGLKAVRQPGSCVTLATDGTVSAHLGVKDEEELKSLPGTSTQSRPELEARVACAVERAWRCFSEGDLAAAEQMLGQGAESKIFLAPTAHTWATRGWIIFTLAVAGLMLVLALQALLK